MLCEAAGYDVVLVETVGVGQSETLVADMVDFFLVLMLAGAGDDLQGIKKGVLEIADMIAVNKADGDNVARAERAAADYRLALHMTTPATPTWTPPVLTCSGLTDAGLDRGVGPDRAAPCASCGRTGELEERRRGQQVRWMWSMIDARLRDDLRETPQVVRELARLEADVLAGRVTPTAAADSVWDLYAEAHRA